MHLVGGGAAGCVGVEDLRPPRHHRRPQGGVLEAVAGQTEAQLQVGGDRRLRRRSREVRNQGTCEEMKVWGLLGGWMGALEVVLYHWCHLRAYEGGGMLGKRRSCEGGACRKERY